MHSDRPNSAVHLLTILAGAILAGSVAVSMAPPSTITVNVDSRPGKRVALICPPRWKA